MPFGNERRASRRLRDHVVEKTDIVAVDEHLLYVDSIDDGMQLPE